MSDDLEWPFCVQEQVLVIPSHWPEAMKKMARAHGRVMEVDLSKPVDKSIVLFPDLERLK